MPDTDTNLFILLLNTIQYNFNYFFLCLLGNDDFNILHPIFLSGLKDFLIVGFHQNSASQEEQNKIQMKIKFIQDIFPFNIGDKTISIELPVGGDHYNEEFHNNFLKILQNKYNEYYNHDIIIPGEIYSIANNIIKVRHELNKTLFLTNEEYLKLIIPLNPDDLLSNFDQNLIGKEVKMLLVGWGDILMLNNGNIVLRPQELSQMLSHLFPITSITEEYDSYSSSSTTIISSPPLPLTTNQHLSFLQNGLLLHSNYILKSIFYQHPKELWEFTYHTNTDHHTDNKSDNKNNSNIRSTLTSPILQLLHSELLEKKELLLALLLLVVYIYSSLLYFSLKYLLK